MQDIPGVQGIQASQRVQTVIIGAGQAGLSVGHHLARRGREFVILDAGARVGDAWRNRWDSLRLFTPAKYTSLDGLPFPLPPNVFPTKDEMADYLEGYAAHFRLPVRTGARVDRVERDGATYRVWTGGQCIEAAHVVVATASYQRPRVPAFAAELDASLMQLHSSDYRNPSQLADGGVLVVGAGNSGAEIALEAARAGHPTWLAGRHPGHVPWRIDGRLALTLLSPLLLRVFFHRVLTERTPMGRRMRASTHGRGTPLVRTKPRDLDAVGVQRVPRVAGARDGRPVLGDGRALDVRTVVWSTGFEPSFAWLHLPVFDEDGEPVHARGVAVGEPGLYFVGMHFQYAVSSSMVHGVGRDAAYVADVIASRAGETRYVAPPLAEAMSA
ncbi:FAD-dependent pyridine nucleotide-disulfide oxidoreductase [Gemmatirosa kalamazoonensis]|uniref:FAD-dependent pyridine nucleotide-disulfide oxidoreductase n=1 Tax=Gemmatirosa kalamazoonensis TaxID=861299 RepID=W0RCS2_9BACT|nr:NAD(P)/FAD-dependent oxidoreductase [Gemmatirosa kalamazoonensis]AHG88217.1 FAD-dependent pyridine nucleotide-disulfide oxidoreductase [Gemmatirosa kalamazoonensis]